MDAFTPIVLAVGAGAVATAARSRRLRNSWNFMLLVKANNRRQVEAEDGVLGGSTRQAVDRLADKHFGGSFEQVTLGDLFPVLCSPEWAEAIAIMLGCLTRHNRIPRSFRPPPWGQYELLRAHWVPRPSRRRHYARPRTALDYVHLANTYAALPVQAEDGAIERVPAEWFREFLRARNSPADEAPIGVLVRALEPGEDSPTWQRDAENSRRCITGRLKREAVLHPEFDDDLPELQPERFAAAFRATSGREIRQS
jgi:hypothetical protein